MTAEAWREESRRLSGRNLNRPGRTAELEHFWCRVAFGTGEQTNYKAHCHSFFELHLGLTGESRMEVDQTPRHLVPGTYLLLPPGKRHRIGSQSADFSKFVWGFSVPDPDTASALAEACADGALHPAQKRIPDRVRLILEDESLRFGAQNVLRGDLQGLFALLMNDLTTFRESEPFGKSESARMEEIRRFLADNLAVGLSTADVARQFSISERQLEQLCRSACGMTPHRLKQALQTEKIRRLLAETALPMEEIARETGFSDRYAMTKFFTRQEGLPPVQYRKSMRR